MHRFDVHRIFYGQKAELTNYLIRVYGSPRIRAISTPDEDAGKAQAAIVVALSQAFDPLSRDFRQVLFFVPQARKEWLKGQVRTMAQELTRRIRAEQSASPEAKEQGAKVLRLLQEWITQLQFPKAETAWPLSAPEFWAAFGYTDKDKIPPWLKISLG